MKNNKIKEEVLKEAEIKAFDELEIAEDMLEYQNYINDDIAFNVIRNAIDLTLAKKDKEFLEFLKKLLIKKHLLDLDVRNKIYYKIKELKK